ncbi:MAG TPA: hypothetical protein ENL40_01080 [Thermococcus litoralis]|uniref:Uncharacterized protein n=1 Tax=Thermococcus litoralis TaxID=2265 RepID=A0A7C5NUE1_THELI|nr:hypothetical protein [Thermococcus litoralis]
MDPSQIILALILVAAFIYAIILTFTGWSESKIKTAATKAGITTGIQLFSYALFRRLNKKTFAITVVTVYPLVFFTIFFNIPWPLADFLNSLVGAAFA